MNRILASALAAGAIVYLLLYIYDSGDSHVLDLAICILITVVYVGIVIHMIEDRRRWLWNAASVGIVFTTAAVAALFSFFGYTYWHGRIEPGLSQGWLDVVRAGLIVGGPIFGAAIVTYRLEKAWKGEATSPGEILSVNGTTWKEGDPERRSNPYGRRTTDYATAHGGKPDQGFSDGPSRRDGGDY